MTTDSILLIHPPVVKPSEPPPGIAKLVGALEHHNAPYMVLDANLEGLHYLCGQPIQAEDTWTRRAATHVEKNLTQLTTPDTFHHPARYRQAVINVNRVLSRSTLQKDVQISLSNFSSNRLSPVKSDDLIRAFETPSENPFFSYFDERLKPLLTREQPSLIGISINFLSQALCAFAMIGVIRQLLPKANITAGGGLITSWLRQDRWQNRFTGIIDHLVPGPGEKALLSMVGVEIKEDPALPVYLKQKAAPYLSPGFILPYSASRGCYWRKCTFCPENSEKTTYRPTPPATVTSQLTSLSKKYKPTLIHLTDNALSPALLKAMMEEPPGPSWYGFARLTHHFADKDYENEKPVIGMSISRNSFVLNYSLEFSKSAQSAVDTNDDWTDFEDRQIEMLGEVFDIIGSDNGTNELELMRGALKPTLEEGETATYTIDGKEYEVTALIIDDTNSKVKFKVNGEVTDSLQKGDVYQLTDGTNIGAREILPNEAGDVTQDMVEFYLGAKKRAF